MVAFVGFYDALDETMAHDVAFVKADETDAGDAFEDFEGFDKTATATGGQINLGGVAGPPFLS